MNGGDIPSAMKLFSVGVLPLVKKSARKPSSEIRIVVGANREVPFESSSGAREKRGFDASYAPVRKAMHRRMSTKVMSQ